MKKTNILYWTFTGLFAAFMLFSGITNAMVTPDSVTLFQSLGYPAYLIAFMGVAKIIGSITILVPGIPRLKEWAYAGLFFDLLGASYSVIMVEGLNPTTSTMVIFFVLGALSYIYYHKRLRQMNTQAERQASTVTA